MNQQTPYPPNQGHPPMQTQQAPQQNGQQIHSTQPQTPSPDPAEAASKSGLAIAGLVLGIVAVATSFMPIINNASFFIGLVGLVLGVIGAVQTRKGTKSGMGLAVAGIVLNIVACVTVVASQAFYSSVLDDAMNSAGISTASAPSSAAVQGSAASQATPAAVESKYAVTIDSAVLGTDYQGNPAVVVTYTWTNNSDRTTSFMASLHAQCFQDGVQCGHAVVSGIDSNSMTDLKPGASTTVQEAYEISGTSDVTIEVAELISFSDEILAEKTFSLA